MKAAWIVLFVLLSSVAMAQQQDPVSYFSLEIINGGPDGVKELNVDYNEVKKSFIVTGSGKGYSKFTDESTGVHNNDIHSIYQHVQKQLKRPVKNKVYTYKGYTITYSVQDAFNYKIVAVKR